MTIKKWPAALCVAALAAAAPAAQAQTPAPQHGYASVSLGMQPTSQDFTQTSTPEIYGENASITVPHSIGGGFIFDLAGGARVWKQLTAGLAFSRFSDKETATLAAQVPNPILFNSPRAATASTGELSHTETAIHLQFGWEFPLTEDFMITPFIGPSFIHVNQDVVNGITTAETAAPPFGTVSISGVSVETAKAWAKGINIGVDGDYAITPTLGAGAFIRFAGGSADLTASDGNTQSVDAGGFQIGAGLRYRF